METTRRPFIQAAGVAGAALFATGTSSAAGTVARGADRAVRDSRAPFLTEPFLDNELLDGTPGVSRRLHPAKKHRLNPVVRCDRGATEFQMAWCRRRI